MKCQHCKTKLSQADKKCPKCKQPVDRKRQENRKFIMICCTVALTALGVILLIAMLSGWRVSSLWRWMLPRENDVFYKNSYSVSDGKAQRRADEVVATLGDAKLTNGQLQVYYWKQVADFMSNYGDQLETLGLDLQKDLAKQTRSDGQTWQQYFLQNAINTWQTNQAYALEAKKNDFQLPEEYQQMLDNAQKQMEETAKKNGFANADAMLQEQMGPGCTASDYLAYLEVYYYGYLYFLQEFNAIEMTEEEIRAYFDEHKKVFEDAGIKEDSGHYVDIRHIMLYPEGGKVDVNGLVSYTQEAWEECRSLGEVILNRYEKGEMTEDAFIELVKLHSEDTTTVANGGLYANTAKGDMMDQIDEWCFDEERKAGDVELIRTDYGYHIVYFVEADEIWHAEAEASLRADLGKEMVSDLLESYDFQVEYKKIVLGKVDLSN